MIKGAIVFACVLLLAAAFGWFVVLAIESFMRDHPNDDDDHLWPSA